MNFPWFPYWILLISLDFASRLLVVLGGFLLPDAGHLVLRVLKELRFQTWKPVEPWWTMGVLHPKTVDPKKNLDPFKFKTLTLGFWELKFWWCRRWFCWLPGNRTTESFRINTPVARTIPTWARVKGQSRVSGTLHGDFLGPRQFTRSQLVRLLVVGPRLIDSCVFLRFPRFWGGVGGVRSGHRFTLQLYYIAYIFMVQHCQFPKLKLDAFSCFPWQKENMFIPFALNSCESVSTLLWVKLSN